MCGQCNHFVQKFKLKDRTVFKKERFSENQPKKKKPTMLLLNKLIGLLPFLVALQLCDLHTQHVTIVTTVPLLSHFNVLITQFFCKQHFIVFTVLFSEDLCL